MEARTRITSAVERRDSLDAEELFELVYPELRRLAQGLMNRERANHTLQATAVVHEAYLRLVDQDRVDWKGRSHFYAVASFCMSRFLKEHARYKNRQKRGGGWRRVTLHEDQAWDQSKDVDIEALDEALTELSTEDSRKAQIVEMKFFGNMTSREIATALDISTRSVERDWRFSRAWLLTRFRGE